MLAWRLMESPPAPSAGAPGVGLLVIAGLVGTATIASLFAGGASGFDGILNVGGSALVLLALAGLLYGLGRLPLPLLDGAGWALVAAVVSLTVWTGLSVVWSIVPDRSWDVFNKTVVFAVFLGLGLVLAAVAGSAAARFGAGVLAGGIAAVLVWALLAKAIPALDSGGDRVARLRVPIDYWNALALLADAGLGLALWVGVARAKVAWRVAGALLAYAATLALLLTLSRAGLAAAAAILALWFVLSPERAEGAVLLAAGVVPAAAVGGWAFTRPALVEDGAAHADRVSDGAVFGVLALVGAALVVAAALLASRLRVTALALTPLRGRLRVGLAILLVVAGTGLAVGVAASRHDISGSCSQVVNEPSRIASLNTNNRWCWWTEAWHVFANKAPLGAGAGSFEVARKRYRKNAGSVVEPHSVPMQELSDGGVAGLLLFVAMVGAGATVCVGALRRLTGRERGAAVAVAVLPAAYLVHALVDYDWDFLAVTAPTMVCLGVLAAAGRPPVRPGRSPLVPGACVVVAVTLLTSFSFPRLSERSGRAALRALDERDYAGAQHEAERARSLDPLAVDPLWTLAAVAARQGRDVDAEHRYVQAVELQPENPDTWYALGMYEYQVVDDFCLAYRYLNNAYTLDSAGTEWVPGGALDRARAAVNAGACTKS
jgi:O-Antigen ligase